MGVRTDTSAKILAAADEVLAEVGYDGASMGRVAERAGVNKALVFYHFDSKSKLVEQVLDQYYRKHRDALANAFAGDEDPRERLHRVVDAYFAFMAEHQTYPRLVQALIASSAEARGLVQGNLLMLFEWTTKMLEDITPSHGPLAARQFYSTFSSIVTGYFNYAPVLAEAWGSDPLAPDALDDRLTHVHWMVDAVLDRLLAEGQA